MIYIFLASGFEEIEAVATVDVLRRAELEAVLVGVGNKKVVGAHGIAVECDITDSQIELNSNLQAIVLPGGMPGTLNLEKSKTVKEAIEFVVEKNLLLCAICAAPSILGHMGILEGKTATCFPGFEAELFGAQVSTESVCVDGRIITGKGPGVAIEFALKIAEILAGKNIANKVMESMLCEF